MKNYVLIFLLFCASTSFAGSDKTIDSKIKSVTVFQQGAQIHREASSYLQKGHQVITLSNLSLAINSSSIQVNGEGDFTIMSVSYQVNYLQETIKEKRIQRIVDSLTDLNYQVKYQGQLVAAFQEEIDFLKANRDLKGNTTGLKIEEIKSGAAYYNSRFKEIFLEKLKIGEKIRDYQEEIQKLQNHLNQLNQQRAPKGIGEILVEIDASAAGNAKFTFDYLVNNAGWSPIYDIRAINVEQPVEMHYRANIYQNTGIDWENVQLAVSTGNPRQNGTIPSMSVWYLNYYNQGGGQRSLSNYSTGSNQPRYEMDADQIQEATTIVSKNKMASNSANFTTVQQGQTNTTFEIALPYTIPSSNSMVNVKVQKWSLPATYRYYAVPRLDPDVFLQARITGWEDLSLLSGEVNIFFEGTYVGKSYLNASLLSDTMNISLGRDKNIVIERKKVKDKNSTAILGSTKKMNIAWEISVKNNKNDAIELMIQDQLPLSNNKEVEVSLNNKSGATYDAKTGFLTWNLQLEAKKSKRLDFDYHVKYPKDLILSNVW